MIATKNLLDALELCPNTNAMGEMLRGLVFNQKDQALGCYSTFETNPEFEKADRAWCSAFWFTYEHSNDPEDFIEVSQLSKGGQIIFQDCILSACWYWEGDGTLAFIVTDLDGNILHELINTDCKKTYRWND